MKNLRIAVAALAAVIFAGSALAANPVEVEVVATMDSTLSLAVVGATMYDMGTFTSNQQKVLATGFVIQNNGGGVTETLGLKGEVYDGWTLFTGAGNPGADQVAADAAFSNAVGGITWNDTTDRLTGSNVAASGANFLGDQDGMNIAYNATNTLWLRITAPSSSSSTNAKRVRCVVTATTP